jgi:hypothetical protein
MGVDALLLNSTGSNNTAIGNNTLQCNTASNNTAVGFCALRNNTSGTLNTALGGFALRSNTIGDNNVAVGIEVSDNRSHPYWTISQRILKYSLTHWTCRWKRLVFINGNFYLNCYYST